jgi:Family of unknown function (DUF6130)
MRKTIGRVAAAIVLIVVASACASGGPSADGSPSPPSSSRRPSSTAKLAIVAPENGSTVVGPTADLRVSLKDARIVKKTSTDLTPDEGHIHVLLDGKLISMSYGLEQKIPDLTPGPHRVQVEFVATDHAPFDPRVIAVTSFQVKR